MEKYVSIDIGGTSIKYGLIDETGSIISRFEMKTEAHKGGKEILEKVSNIVKRFEESGKINGICISTAGMVDTGKGMVFYAAPLIPDYAGTNFKEKMEHQFGVSCEVENDVNCAGLRNI